MADPLLTTKLVGPPARPDLVLRPRLNDRLDDGLSPGTRLILVSAPAGYGKTTLVSAWLQPAGRPPPLDRRAWLSLDEGDNDPVRFLAYLIAAFQTVDARFGASLTPRLASPAPLAPQAVLGSLLNELAASSTPVALVLDDYHLIHTLAIHEQLAFLLDHQPPHFHLILVTREDPPMPLPRLRARGQMVEVREADLRFTAEEAARFMESMQVAVSQNDVLALQRRTEGWIAGLQLAALSLRGSADVARRIADFTGSHRYVLDYLVEEVLRQQPARVRDFLFRTAILERLCAPLCASLLADRDTERAESVDGAASDDPGAIADAQQMLDTMEHGNLFIVPLDASRQWYRYHRLFADLLQHRAPVALGIDVVELHRRASLWYGAHDLARDAVHHALAARDWGRAIDLLESGLSETLLKHGEMATLLSYYQALPDTRVRADPQLCLAVSWPLILTEQLESAESYLAQAAEVAEGLGEQGAPLRGAVLAAQVHIARMRGDHQSAMTLSEQALALLPEDDVTSRSVVALNLGMAHWYRGRLAEAERALKEAARAGRGSGNDYALYSALTFLGRIDVARGHLRRAVAGCRDRIRQGGKQSIGCLAHYDLARLLYEWNELDEAAVFLTQGIELARGGGSAEFLAGGASTLAIVEAARGHGADAQAALDQAAEQLDAADISVSTRLANLTARISVALARGDLQAAASAVSEIPLPDQAGSYPDHLGLLLAQARHLLTAGRRSEAAGLLESLHDMASETGWATVVIQAQALQALAVADADAALALLRRALALAEPEGYVRTFVDGGALMAEKLAALSAQLSAGHRPDWAAANLESPSRAYVARLLGAFAPTQDRGLAPDEASPTYSATTVSAGVSEASAGPVSHLIEPLSDRELDVMRVLAGGHTNQEIALALHVSVNTVKTHLKNIYGKLAVGTRRQAVAKARSLRLIP